MNYSFAARGLNYLFWGKIIGLLSIFSVLFGEFPAIIGSAVVLYGFYMLSKTTVDFQTAFYLQIVCLILTLLYFFCGSGILSYIVSIIQSIVSLAVLYYVCLGIARMVGDMDSKLIARAHTVWKLTLICTIVLTISLLLMCLPLTVIFAILPTLVASIAQIVAGILYLKLLRDSYKLLRRYC